MRLRSAVIPLGSVFACTGVAVALQAQGATPAPPKGFTALFNGRI
jgi:hypothetical protein